MRTAHLKFGSFLAPKQAKPYMCEKVGSSSNHSFSESLRAFLLIKPSLESYGAEFSKEPIIFDRRNISGAFSGTFRFLTLARLGVTLRPRKCAENPPAPLSFVSWPL